MIGDADMDRMNDIEYMLTHARDGHPLGSPEYPDNRAGRRKLAHSWRGVMRKDGWPVRYHQ